MKILVTGVKGQLGYDIVNECQKRNIEAIGVDIEEMDITKDVYKRQIVDIYENNVYDVQQELIRKYGNKLKMRIYIASVRDVKRMEEIFREVKPEMVFHAAAHKHVPLMEASGCEAIKNNVMGTYNKANLAEKYGVEKFLLISTDKVVNPTNIMGVRLKTSC